MELTQWALVAIYVVAMFVYAGQEASSAGYTSKLLAKWLPQLSNAELRQYVVVLRKTGHVLAYGLLTFIVYSAASKTKKLRRSALPFAMIFAFLVAIADESYQKRLIYRTGSWSDVVLDGIGVSVVALGIWLQAKMKEKKSLEVTEDVEDECI